MSEHVRLSAVVWLILCGTLTYLPHLGHGFVGWDFDWLLRSDVRSSEDVWAVVSAPVTGAYRPAVTASLALNLGVSGLSPVGHGLMNLALAGAVAAAVSALALACDLGTAGAVFAAAAWAFHVDTIGPATIMIAGRGILLSTLGATLAAVAVIRGRPGWAFGWTLLALLSHESAWPVPLVLAVWILLDRRREGDPLGVAALAALPRTATSFAAVALGLALRSAAIGSGGGAGTGPVMSTASVHALFAEDAGGLVYSALLGALALALPTLALRAGMAEPTAIRRGTVLETEVTRASASLDDIETRTLLKGALWLAPGVIAKIVAISSGGHVEPDASMPSVGLALMVGSAGLALQRRILPRWRGRALGVALLLPLLMVPVLWIRNARLAAEARLSTAVLGRVFTVLRERHDIQRVELYQSAGESPSIQTALGGGLPAALRLGTGRRLEAGVHLSQPSDPWPSPQAFTLRLTVSGAEIIAVAPPQ